MSSPRTYDVVILGGGLAGLSLAMQLKKTQPGIKIFVAERTRHPVPEAAFKVGESTVEVGARYFADVVGMKEHLETDQLRKMGLRYFFPAGDNLDIARRVEVGPASLPAIPAYQIDRGRFENKLAEEIQNAGAHFQDDCAVEQVDLGPTLHTVKLRRNGTATLTTRWVVDATGRAALLKRQLNLAKANDHNVNAAWFRIQAPIAVDDWSEEAEWQSRVPSRKRMLSTNHLMGNGYWVWLIPLASGSTSFGIVADPELHPFDHINTFERAQRWLRKYEPQCAAIVEQHVHELQDFRVMKHFSHDCKRVFSTERWCLTGEAGVFLDPFYSPGSDFIAFANSYITDLICRDLCGESIEQRTEFFNRQHLTLFHGSLSFFEHRYPLMGNAQVMTAKIVWDTAAYWAMPAFLYFHDKLCDVEFMRAINPYMLRFLRLNFRVQTLFADWRSLGQLPCEDFFVNLQKLDFLNRDIYGALTRPLDDAGVVERIKRNLELLQSVAAQFCRRSGEIDSNADLLSTPIPPATDAFVAEGLQHGWLNPERMPAELATCSDASLT
jgi:flavin-dependent dehydrogenase